MNGAPSVTSAATSNVAKKTMAARINSFIAPFLRQRASAALYHASVGREKVLPGQWLAGAMVSGCLQAERRKLPTPHALSSLAE
jgi:hypothetical protein